MSKLNTSICRRFFRSVLAVPLGIAIATLFLATPVALAAPPPPDNVVLQWDNAALQGIRDLHPGPPMAARELAIVHTCMYDAWAAYSFRAVGTQLGGTLRRPHDEFSTANKNQAISYAAYRALVDLYPGDTAAVFTPLLNSLGFSETNLSVDTTTPAGIGNVACAAVLAFRHHDGSNQLGDLHPGPYSDYTGFVPVNPPSTVPVAKSTIVDPNKWQPLTYDDGLTAPIPHIITQNFVGAQWENVIPFALTSAHQYDAFEQQFGPATFGTQAYVDQSQELIDISANLTDKQKLIAEYWANGPKSELPPGHWCLFAQYVSHRDNHTLNEDVKMFFAMTNAIFDGSIAAWGQKRVTDSVRPVTSIPYLFTGTLIRSWVPFHGTQTIDGSQWLSYQKSSFPTPPFPEFISGHSTFSAAGAAVLVLWTGSNQFGDSVTFAPGSSATEPGLVPAQTVTLLWPTFFDAANEAGISRRYGGIHFKAGDLVGRAVGRILGEQAWHKSLTYFNPNDPAHFQDHRDDLN
ncbi:MAG: DUF6851 domain-containing protein [Acidobacteriaceae bacterium]